MKKTKFQRVKELIKKGLQDKEIATQIGSPLSQVKNTIRLIKKGFESQNEYQSRLVSANGFDSLFRYKEIQRIKRGFKSESEETRLTNSAKKAGKSLNEFLQCIAEADGYESHEKFKKILPEIDPFSHEIPTDPKQLEQIILAEPRQAGVEYIETQKKLYRILDQLNKRERDLIELHYFNGQTLSQIGKRYGITGERVRQIKNRALANLASLARTQDIEITDLH